MKTSIKAILGVAALTAASSALAIDPASVPRTSTLYISGATATNDALVQLALLSAGGLCDASAGTIDVFVDTAGAAIATDQNDQVMIACTSTASQFTGATDIVLLKESNGGSSRGTVQVALSQAIPFLSKTAPTCSTTGVVVNEAGLEQYTLSSGCTGVENIVPDAGIADVEAQLFLDSSQAVVDGLTATSLLQVIFAPVVTENLYRELQDAQGLALDDTEANVPSLTLGQLHALYSGAITQWNQLQVDGAAGAGPDFISGGNVTSPTSPFVLHCRRGNDSGTQAGFASFFLNERCNATVPAFIPPTQTFTTQDCEAEGCDWDPVEFGNEVVFAADGSSDVRNCMDARNDAGFLAIGVLSTNTTIPAETIIDPATGETADTATDYRFIGINGGAPTLSSIANGAYPFVTENVLNVRSSGGPTGNTANIVTFITSQFGQPSIISGLLEVGVAGGDTGVLAIANGTTIVPNAPPVTPAAMLTNPVSSLSRSVGGSANNCQPQSALPDAQLLNGGL